MSLSRSELTTEVGKTRAGFRSNRVAGEHLRLKCLTIGKSIDTGSPCSQISTTATSCQCSLRHIPA